jgi:hypothetical protein
MGLLIYRGSTKFFIVVKVTCSVFSKAQQWRIVSRKKKRFHIVPDASNMKLLFSLSDLSARTILQVFFGTNVGNTSVIKRNEH